MDNFSARQAIDPHGSDHRFSTMIGDPADLLDADDPLGDEAAFPSTWQHLAAGEAPRD